MTANLALRQLIALRAYMPKPCLVLWPAPPAHLLGVRLQVGPWRLRTRIVYAPLTRNRSPGMVPRPEVATYYSQRACKGGLMLTEATCISQGAAG